MQSFPKFIKSWADKVIKQTANTANIHFRQNDPNQ